MTKKFASLLILFLVSCSQPDPNKPWEVVGIKDIGDNQCEYMVVQWVKVGLPYRDEFIDTCGKYYFSQNIKIDKK
jgi:hypothetical protein